MYKLPVELTLKELNAHKELDRLALVRPKKEPEISIVPVSNHVVSLEKPDPHDLMMRDLDYINRLDKISRNSIEGATGRILKAGIYPKVTPEMREKYLLEEQKNQRDYYKSLTAGDPALFAKIPDIRVQLEQPNSSALVFMKSEDQIRREIKDAITKIEEIDKLRAIIDSTVFTNADILEHEREIAKLKLTQSRFPSEKAKKEIERMKSDLKKALDGYPDEKRKLAEGKDKFNEMLSNLYSELYEYKQLEEIDNADKKRVDEANANKLQLLEEEFNILNRGKFSIQREPNETDDEYLQRMEDVGNITIDKNDLNADIARETKNVLKSHLREFIRDNGVKEGILREIEHRYGEQDAPLKNDKLIQLFPEFKQKTIDIFGENPSYSTVSSIVDLIDNIFSNRTIKEIIDDDKKYDGKKKKPGLEELEKLEDDIPEADVRLVKKFTQNMMILDYYHNYDPEKKEAEAVDDIDEVKKRVKARAVGRTKGTTWEEYKKKATDYFYSQPGIQKPGPLTRAKSQDTEKKSITSFFEKKGKGLKSGADKLSDYCEIGEIMVMPKKLFYKNTLSIRSLKGNAFTGIKDCQVSDNLAKIILELCQGKVPAHQEIKHLSSCEKRIFDELVYMAKLHKEVSHSGEDTIKQLKHRLSILEGEVQAGNNNPDVLREIHKIVNVLSRMGAVSHNNAREYLQETVGGLIKPRRKSKK